MTFNLKAAYPTIELLTSAWPKCFALKFAERKPLKVARDSRGVLWSRTFTHRGTIFKSGCAVECALPQARGGSFRPCLRIRKLPKGRAAARKALRDGRRRLKSNASQQTNGPHLGSPPDSLIQWLG